LLVSSETLQLGNVLEFRFQTVSLELVSGLVAVAVMAEGDEVSRVVATTLGLELDVMNFEIGTLI
jgi:hypothetical protein